LREIPLDFTSSKSSANVQQVPICKNGTFAGCDLNVSGSVLARAFGFGLRAAASLEVVLRKLTRAHCGPGATDRLFFNELLRKRG
jgi:hypothetical protein